MSGEWINHYVKEIDHLHVIPAKDTIPHCPAPTCYCKPSLEIVARDDDSVGAVYLHKVRGK